MSLQSYVDEKVQAFRKLGRGDLLFGLQDSTTFKLLPIHDAHESGSTSSPTSIVAVNISREYPFAELGRVTLPNDLIVFDSGTNQYLIDNTKTITGLLENTTYYLEFKNGYNIFTTGPFLVKEMILRITADMTIITADSTIIKIDTTKITI